MKRFGRRRHLQGMEETYLAMSQTVAGVVARAAAGDRDAFADLVVQHSPDMIRAAFIVSSDIEATRDATQSAWQRIWANLGQLRDHDRFHAWAVTIAVNEVKAIARKDRRRQIREVAVSAGEIQALDVSEEASRRVDLERALRTLQEDDRELLALRYIAGLSAAEIATPRGITASGVRARLSRLNGTLRKELER